MKATQRNYNPIYPSQIFKTALKSACFNSIHLCVCLSDPSGSEVQQLGGLVVLRCAAVRDADRSVSVPRPRRRGAVSVYTHRQPRLSPLADQRRQRHPGQGR